MTSAHLPVRAVAFDLDGTLVDSAADIAHALDTALRRAHLLQGMAPFDVDTVRGWVGDGPDATIARALRRMKERGDPVDGVDAAALRLSFDAATLAAPLGRGSVYAGIAAALQQLDALCPLVVVTNKPSALARAVLGGALLSQHFRAVYGADRPEQRKPAPALLEQAARDLGIATGELLMVGDSGADIGAARAAGARAAWVAWGYGHGTPDADVLRIDRPGLLPGHVLLAMEEAQHADRR